ncbi:MAG: lysophospholipid acyltransferase family protein [Myxococcaceae bacterium]|nr:lysophospholipid acyltransferase family protein [Myxococcaceae bacterium]
MIRDAKGGLFSRVIDWYIGRKVRSAFRGVWVRGQLPSSRDGLVAYLNHSSFWDGFIAHQLGLAAGWDSYAVMEEQNLAKYPFHTRIGAFSIRRGDPRSAVETLKYAKTVLSRPNACVIIFPQGEIRAGQGPLGELSRGVEVLARSSKKPAVPIAIRYAFLEHEHPDVLIEVGTPHAAGDLARYESSLGEVYERVLSARSTEGFTAVVRGRRGVQERWDAVRRLPASKVTEEGPRQQHAVQS